MGNFSSIIWMKKSSIHKLWMSISFAYNVRLRWFLHCRVCFNKGYTHASRKTFWKQKLEKFKANFLFWKLIGINLKIFTSFTYKSEIEHCFCHCAYRKEHQMCRRFQPIWWGTYLKVCSKVWHMVHRMGVQHISKITFVLVNTTILLECCAINKLS
jgi:hypothetical protein